MAKRKSEFVRLGEHIARDGAREIRERAATRPDDPKAQADLANLNAAASDESMRARVHAIVRRHLEDADQTLDQALPLAGDMAVGEYADALLGWSREANAKFVFDSPEGRMASAVGLCAEILKGTSLHVPDFDLGVILGYGLAQKHFLLVREFADGPALARERYLAQKRLEGAEGTKKVALKKAERVETAFWAARKINPTLKPASFARNHEGLQSLGYDRLRKIAAKALRRQKVKLGEAQQTPKREG